MTAAFLAWRGSRLAAAAFVAAMGLLLPVFWFIFPGDRVLFLPSFAVILLCALVGYWYLGSVRRPTA